MAPRTGARRNQSQSEEIYELGKQGRKTGITIRDTGARDEHGMQPLEDIFSSPEKTATVNMNAARTPSVNGEQYSENEDDDSDGLPMDIENTTAPDVARLMMPLPRARSPAKTFLQSPAHKNRYLGPSSSPVRGSIVEQRAREEADRGQSPKRRLDFGLNGVSRPVLKPTRTSPRTTRKGRETSRDEEEDDEEAILQGQDDTNGHEESMALIDVGGGGDDDMPINGDGDDDVELGEDSRNEDVSRWNGHAARRTTRRSGRLSESLLADDTGNIPEAEPESEEEETENEEEPAPEPSPVQSRKRGRPAGKAAAAQQHDEEEEEAPQRATKRRRSNNPLGPEPSEPEPKKSAGRPRRRPGAVAKQTTATTFETNEASAPTAQKPKGKRGHPGKEAARRSESPAAAAADTSLAVVPRGPPLPRSRGLLINRRVEVPGSNDGILRTRSGRNSFKPLAFWRNEHVDYDQDAATDDVFVRGGKVGKVLLPTVKEIVRVEQEEAPTKKKPGYKSRSSATASKSKRKPSAGANPFFDADPAEPWEEEPGSVTGDAVVWRAEYDWFPPALEDEVEVEPEQLAVSGQAIQTREIRNATFKFAKTLSMPFFGAGVVDLPPGAEKRPKNSRKMFMAFFVFSGRVLVTVNETSFRISRGGMWFVPRGNTYSIENDYDEPARVFFSQGCEPLQRPSDVDEDALPAEGA